MMMPIMLAMKICAPNIANGPAASKAMINPISRLIREMMGSALTPATSKTRHTSPQRMALGRARFATIPVATAPTNDTSSFKSPTAATAVSPTSSASDFFGSGWGRFLW